MLTVFGARSPAETIGGPDQNAAHELKGEKERTRQERLRSWPQAQRCVAGIATSPLRPPSIPYPGITSQAMSKTNKKLTWSCLRWGRSNLDDPAGWRGNCFTKLGFGEHFVGLSWEKKSKTKSSLNFHQSGPLKFTKSNFSGLAPVQ